jgi:hypothetical protein
LLIAAGEAANALASIGSSPARFRERGHQAPSMWQVDATIGAAAEVADEVRGRQAILVVAGHSTNAQDCTELLEMLGLTDLSQGHRDAPKLPPPPAMV